MKPIKFDLPLNGIRITTLDQLEENLTPEILQHFRSGKLAKWLRVRHLNEQADKVEALLATDIEDEVQLFKNVCEVFVGEVEENDAREAIEEYNATIKDMNKEEKEPVGYQEEVLQDHAILTDDSTKVAQTTAAMLTAQPILNDVKDQLDQINEAKKTPIESNKIEGINSKNEINWLREMVIESNKKTFSKNKSNWPNEEELYCSSVTDTTPLVKEEISPLCRKVYESKDTSETTKRLLERIYIIDGK